MAASDDPKNKSELRIFESLDELRTDLAEYIAQISEASVKARGIFSIALSGGSLISLIRKLCEAPYNWTVDWTKWYVFWTDERAVAKNHVDSNYKLTKDEFLSKVPVLNNHVYSIKDAMTVEETASDYEFVIRQLVKARTLNVSEINDCPKFDLILLSMGSDGHVASLFPKHRALGQKSDWITYVINSPEPPLERITFTLPVINSAANVALVATGEDKAKVVQLIVGDSDEVSNAASSLPAGRIQPTEGKLVWFLDMPAASLLGGPQHDGSQRLVGGPQHDGSQLSEVIKQ